MNSTQVKTQNFWFDPKWRGVIFQALALIVVSTLAFIAVSTTQSNLAQQNIASGFGFLKAEAGFEISETMIEYWADDTYLYALWVGLLNTLKIGFIGNILAIMLGVVVGVSRLSSNWLVSKLSQTYIETVRNIPLLLQLLFWYAIFTEIFPSVQQAYEILPHTFVSQRGLFIPIFEEHFIWKYMWAALALAVALSWFIRKRFDVYRRKSGIQRNIWPYVVGLILVLPVMTWLVGGSPTKLDLPSLGGFNFQGGMGFSPEFVALLLGLVVYTGAFNAEIVRSGIESVSKGQWEAAGSLGLSRVQALRLIILPQSLRVIIPPITSQILNLIKNSSLAVGIGYPDFVSVANTTMNQTGQAIEGVLLIMMCYLFFSLSISVIMNLYNNSISLKQR